MVGRGGLIALAAFLAGVAATAPAHADRCGPPAAAWVARCAERSVLPMSLADCPAAVAIVEVRPPGASPLRVEVSTSPSAFRRAGAYGLSPIGSFADWKEEPEPTRRAFEAVAACVASDPPDALLSPNASPPGTPPSRPPLPLPLLGAALLLTVLGVLARVSPRRVAVAALAFVATFSLRRLLQPITFFHQNGQGAEWVRFAVQGDAGAYGPGYPELFGWIAARARRPDLALIVGQELLAATAPLAAYALARSLSLRRGVAIAAGLVVALDPVLMRTARSESYYAAITALLFAAAAVVAHTDRGRLRLLGALAAGLLVGQAARIHPVAWVACATVTLPLLCRPGRPRQRLARAAVATAIVGATSLVLALPSMRAALRSPLGDGFAQARVVAVHAAPYVGVLFVAAAVATALLGPARTLRGWALALAVGAAIASNQLAGNIAVVSSSYLHLFLPAALGAALALRVRGLALAILALAALHGYRERAIVAPTTDNLELMWCLDWRETLPPGARVHALERAGQRTLLLPLLARSAPLDGEITRPAFYYRSSLCASPEGAPLCADFESRHTLRPVASRKLPSRPSASWLLLPPGELEVGLFAIE